jgi:hypothetical protein
MKRLLPLILIAALLLPYTASATANPTTSQSVKLPDGPEFWVHNVVHNDSVTIALKDFPKDKVYRVFMGDIGNNFGSGIQVGVLTRSAREFRATFDIPRWLYNQKLIALVLRDRETSEQGYVMFANVTGYNSLQMISLEPVAQASHQSAGTSVGIFNGPEFWVHSVEKKWHFTLKFNNWRSNDKFKVFVGQNNDDFEWIWVGLVYGKKPRSFTQTFDIPSALRNTRIIKVVVVSNFTGHSGSTAFTNADDWEVTVPSGEYNWAYINSAIAAKKSTGKLPFTEILNVVEDTEITMRIFNFPEDTDVTVMMGPIGSRAINGLVVDEFNTGYYDDEDYKYIVKTFPIPGQLKGLDPIAIRLESDSTDHYSYDYFRNLDGYNYIDLGAEAYSGDWLLPPGTYPHTVVNKINKNDSVKISGFNFTKNDEYTVRMAPFGNKAIGGIIVATFDTGDESTFTKKFEIPAGLQGISPIAIRFESKNSTYYAYDYFYND